MFTVYFCLERTTTQNEMFITIPSEQNVAKQHIQQNTPVTMVGKRNEKQPSSISTDPPVHCEVLCDPKPVQFRRCQNVNIKTTRCTRRCDVHGNKTKYSIEH